MTQDESTPEARTAFLCDRIERFTVSPGDMTEDGKQEFEAMRRMILVAFQKAEERGERRGMLKGCALSKLTDAERRALGV